MPTHKVTLHFRSLSLTVSPFSEIFIKAQQVYAQYGIHVVFGSGVSLGLPSDQANRFAVVDGSCEWDPGLEYSEIQSLGGWVPANEILVFYVSRFASNTLLGCGGSKPGRPACIVASAGSEWDTAHEVGHVLLSSSFASVHSEDVNNLMYQYSRASALGCPTLDNLQLERIKNSPYCIAL